MHFPILKVSNDGEARWSRLYAEQAKNAKYLPVLWTVSRAGHVNINSAERLSALRAVIAWSESGERPENKTAMIVMERASRAAFIGRVAGGTVTRLRPLYGNIYTNLVVDDLHTLGIKLGDIFALTHGKQTVTATFANAYSDVPLGEWVAFIDPESYVQISRNYENATMTLGVEVGDTLLISHIK
jgi:S-adenosylmethionine hydrolase